MKEGRGGGSQDITQGLCLSCPTHSLHTHQSVHVNMHMNRYIGTHMQTRAKVRTHCFARWTIKNTTVLVGQRIERGQRKITLNMNRMSVETVMTKFLPVPCVSPLFSRCFCSQDARRSILPREARDTIYALNIQIPALFVTQCSFWNHLSHHFFFFKNHVKIKLTVKIKLLTLQIHLLSFCEHLITPAASCTAGMVVLISCLRKEKKRLFLSA